MKKIFKKFCVPFLLINNNVYTFLSGVIISLSINIFSTLCIEKFTFNDGWHMYASFISFLVSGSLFIYIATKVTSYQNYIVSKQIIDAEQKANILIDFEGKKAIGWFFIILSLILTTLGGCVFLALNYFL